MFDCLWICDGVSNSFSPVIFSVYIIQYAFLNKSFAITMSVVTGLFFSVCFGVDRVIVASVNELMHRFRGLWRV